MANSKLCVSDSFVDRMLRRAYSATPQDRIICAVSANAYSTIFGIIPTALAVLRIAAEVEPMPSRLLDWYQNDAIWQLGSLTAEQLVAMGRGEAVIDFLRQIPRSHD